jgi:UDP-N-acetylglucosamine acyltransferase
MPFIHPTAIIDSRAELSDGVRVEAYAVIDGPVTVGPRTVVKSHSVLNGPTRIGADCRIGPGAYVGLDPQHLAFKGGDTWLVLGDGVTVREGASLHRATKPGEENATRVGDRCYLMANSHVAHDCRLGEDVIFANGALVGGHVEVGPRAFVSGGAAVHQFARVGRLAIVSGNEAATRDVPPFAAVRYGGLKGYNAIGCKRAGMSRESIHAVRAAFQCLHTHRTTPDAVRAIRETVPGLPEVREMLDFIASSKRGIQPSLRFVAYYRGDSEAD